MTRGQYSVKTLTCSAGRIPCAGTLFINRRFIYAYLSLIGDPRQLMCLGAIRFVTIRGTCRDSFQDDEIVSLTVS